jgi:glycosyltransferase involved in cell wall biosynthesis
VRRPRAWRRGDDLPALTLVIPAFREREALAQKLRALEELDYPAELLQVVVPVDEDRELARIAKHASPRAEVLFTPRREGKATALNRALAVATGDAIVLTDANNILRPDSLRAAVRHLADPEVWAVAGRRGEVGSAYERYEDLVRRLETRSGSVAAMSGELIVVRRERLPEFPAGVINDDFWLLCRLVSAGGRVVYEPAAASTEELLGPRQELTRRARISAGRVLLVPEVRRLPLGFASRILSHKLGRLALAPLLVGMLGSSLALARRPAYRALALAQLVLYAPGMLALAGAPVPARRSLFVRASRELVLGCTGTTVGLVRGLRRRQAITWDPVR